MRVRHVQVGEQIGVLFEEVRAGAEVFGDSLGGQRVLSHVLVDSLKVAVRASMSTWPLKTVAAGPRMRRRPSSQSMCSVPPCVSTRTGFASRPRRMPATAAAQAPVPQARV